MRSLFLKIFLSFWIAQALFLVLAILVTMALRPSRELDAWEAMQPRVLTEAVKTYRTQGVESLRNYLRGVHEAQHVRLFLFDQNGVELTGRKPPDWIMGVQQGRIHTADTFLGRLRSVPFLRASITADDGRRYMLVSELPPGPTALFGPHGIPGLGFLIGIISSGLVCYVLARYLTAPVVRLRAATRQLAEGDLTARAGSQGRGLQRYDEIAGLVRDFDAMAERLEKLVKAQSRLLNDISHELRSPLARLTVGLALARQRTGTEAQSSLDRIELEAERLNELIGRLLTVARLDAGDEAVQKSPVDLTELIHDIAKDANFEAQNRHCHVEVAASGECMVMGSLTLLHSAIENVVRNAIRHTGEGTRVQIILQAGGQPAGSQAILRVLDSGPGVPEESLEKLFRPFYRIEADRGRGTGGVGLGLAIADRAIRLHSGTVRASNRAEGGLEVEISLPTLTPYSRPAVPESTPALEHRA